MILQSLSREVVSGGSESRHMARQPLSDDQQDLEETGEVPQPRKGAKQPKSKPGLRSDQVSDLKAVGQRERTEVCAAVDRGGEHGGGRGTRSSGCSRG